MGKFKIQVTLFSFLPILGRIKQTFSKYVIHILTTLCLIFCTTVYVCDTCLVIKLSFFFSHISGITTVLTLSTIALDSRTDLPKVHYATALDWFIICCFGYCIATLLQFAGVHYFTKVFTVYIFAYEGIFSVYNEVMHVWSSLKFTG